MSFYLYAFEEMRLPIELLTAVLLFLLPYAEKKPNFTARVVISMVGMTLFSLLYFVLFGGDKLHPQNQVGVVFWYFLIFLFAPIFSGICFTLTKCDALLLSTLALPLQNIVYSFYHSYIAKIAFPFLREHLALYILGSVLCCAFLYIPAYHMFAPLLRKSEPPLMEDTPKNLTLNAFIYLVFYILLIYYQSVFQTGPAILDYFSFTSGILVCILILALQYNTINNMIVSEQTKNMERLIKNNEHYYHLSKEHIAIINRKCHDLKHQLKILKTVNDAERNDFINEAENSINFYQDLIYTENEALNTILAEKGLFCRESGIDFHCSVDNADLSFIRVSDLYAIMGNAIDNAIEYARKQTDENLRSISMKIEQKNSFIGIQITNPLSEKDCMTYERTKGILPSTKDDRFDHGFGLKSIRYLCEKYGGTMEYSTTDALFVLQIVFPV